MDSPLENFVFILSTLYIDDQEDMDFLARKLKGSLSKIKKDKRRLLVYVCTEPVKQLEVKE